MWGLLRSRCPRAHCELPFQQSLAAVITCPPPSSFPALTFSSLPTQIGSQAPGSPEAPEGLVREPVGALLQSVRFQPRICIPNCPGPDIPLGEPEGGFTFFGLQENEYVGPNNTLEPSERADLTLECARTLNQFR